jgi:hypothetical protein
MVTISRFYSNSNGNSFTAQKNWTRDYVIEDAGEENMSRTLRRFLRQWKQNNPSSERLTPITVIKIQWTEKVGVDSYLGGARL